MLKSQIKITNKNSFNNQIKEELQEFLNVQAKKFPENETLKIDLHCHDHNSDVPDELIGRILGVPETWTDTETVIGTAKKNGCNVLTITNHNNAKSCFELQKQGKDILIGSEFSCFVPDFDTGIHVLAYGFTKKQEEKLLKLRKNLYLFLQYAHKYNIPTIWAHPLYNYKNKDEIPMDFYHKMMLVFNRFEVLNGQRDTWQNMLVKNWVEQISPELIDKNASKFELDLNLYTDKPYKKSMSGGSDSHMGIFTGQTGTLLHIPNLQERLKSENPSDLALEAIRNGDMVPYGTHQNSEKLTIAFIEYFMQIALYRKDAGLLRIFTHKGDHKTKILAVVIANAFSEITRHKVTMRFVKIFHENFLGKPLPKIKRIVVSKDYKPIFDQANKIANCCNFKGEKMLNEFSDALNSIIDEFNNIFYSRLNKKLDKLSESISFENVDWQNIIEKIELPTDFRSLFLSNKNKRKRKMSSPDIPDFMDGLSFPLLASVLLAGANFASSKVLYNNRSLLNIISENLGKLKHPKRMLWLTDTFNDKNGVSSVLQEIHKEIKSRDLPIDIVVCSSTVEADEHLIVVEPLLEYMLPFYKEQTIRIPNLQKIHILFFENGYDRIMCSTEGVMGLVAVYLKNAFTVPASFYMHTDWLMFARKMLKFDAKNIDRARRFLRSYYGLFDNLFVLNKSHKKWLSSIEMGFSKKQVHKTAHWVDEKFYPRKKTKKEMFNLSNDDKVLLFAGRLSKEKGILDIPYIYKIVKEKIPNIKIVFAGTGPVEKELKTLLPDAIFLGWVQSEILPEIYSATDMLILPSRFDTFSLVVLESLSCGTPVAAYNSKGPKDIIEDKKCGLLSKSKKELADNIIDFFTNSIYQETFPKQAIERAKTYKKDIILNELLNDVGLA